MVMAAAADDEQGDSVAAYVGECCSQVGAGEGADDPAPCASPGTEGGALPGVAGAPWTDGTPPT